VLAEAVPAMTAPKIRNERADPRAKQKIQDLLSPDPRRSSDCKIDREFAMMITPHSPY
jgi:hypothetical protein